MKVLQVINVLARGGGAEKIVLDLTLSMKKKGIDVELLSVWNPYTIGKGEFCNILKQHNIPVHFLNESKLYSPINMHRYYKLIQNGNYDIVHAHLFPVLYYSGLVSWFIPKKTKFVYTEHSTNNRRRYLTIFKFFDRLIYKRYIKVVCITQVVEAALKKHLLNVNSAIIPNGIDIELFSEAMPMLKRDIIPNCTENNRFLLMNARLVDAKDHLTLFRAMKLLPINVHLLLIGLGEHENKYKKYCIEEQLISRVHFLGSRSDVARLIKTADINILSSNHEGFSISMLECMASGKPFVASAVPGIEDLIKGFAVLFPHKNETILAEEINRLLVDEVYAEEIAHKCQNFAMKFDIKNSADAYIDLYKAIVCVG